MTSPRFRFLVAALVFASCLPGGNDAHAAPPLRLGVHAGLGAEVSGTVEVGAEAGMFLRPELSLGLAARYAHGLDDGCELCFAAGFGLGPTLHDRKRQGFVSAKVGYSFLYEDLPGLEAVPAPVPGEPAEEPREVGAEIEARPELELAFGSAFAIGSGVSLGPVVRVGLGGRDSRAPGMVRASAGLGGTFDVAPSPEPRPERGPLGLSAGLRAFVVHSPGIGAELGYALLPELEIGAQAFSIVHPFGGEYCSDCETEDDRLVGFVEGRLPVLPFLTPYARAMGGAGRIEGEECAYDECTPYRRLSGVHATFGGEIGVEVHGGGLSARAFGLGLAYPDYEKQGGLGFGLQLGARL